MSVTPDYGLHITTRGCRAATGADVGAGKPNVFLAEDDPLLRRALVRWLQLDGYRVVAAESGRVLLEYMLELPVSEPESGDVLVTDVDMPGLDGFQLVDRLQVAGWRLPVVFMTGDPSADVQRRARELRALGFLPKPFSLGELTGAVESAAR
jgi:two-component system cell cycle sensor histidine kinase/response regulator CckA